MVNIYGKGFFVVLIVFPLQSNLNGNLLCEIYCVKKTQ